MKGNLILAEIKMDICVKLISAGTPEKGITEKVN
jgi:hypothetical protein